MWNRPHLLLWIGNALYALAALMLLYACLYYVLHMPIFPLRTVRVEGSLSHVTREQVRLIADRYLHGNFFTVNLEQVGAVFQKLPWVRNVSLRRRWPATLEVVVEEHRELARWGNIALVNTHGELFHAASDSDLPVFYGPGDEVHEIAERYESFSATLRPAGIAIAQLSLSPRHAWQIGTDGGMVIELGREKMEQRLQRFSTVYAHTLAPLHVPVAYADLRYPNGFAVRESRKAPAKKNTDASKRAA